MFRRNLLSGIRMGRPRQRRRSAHVLEELEPRWLLHQGRQAPSIALLPTHGIRPVPMVNLPGAPMGPSINPPPAPGATVNVNASTVIIPFVDRGGVLNVYDSLRNRVVNTGQVARSIQVDAFNQNVYFLTSETAGGKDLDRDGRVDSNDTVLQFYNVTTGRVTNTRLQVASTYTANTGSLTPLVAFLLLEPAAGRDLNRDGDTRDNVAVVYDVLSHRLMNTREEAESFAFSNNLMTFVTNEAKQGQDLNRDGTIRANDELLLAYDPLGNLPFGRLTNLGKLVDGT
jgi:hypothetical protein